MAYERKVKITKATNDIYKFYKEKFGKDALGEKKFKQIYYDLNKEISNLIITRSLEYSLPFRMGHLRIKKKKLRLKLTDDGRIDINRNITDWGATWDYWNELYPGKTRKEIKQIPGKKVLFQMNYHTDGDIMAWEWDKRSSRAKNKTYYKFRPVKGGNMDGYYVGRLGLGEWIKSDERTNDYFY